MGRANTIETQGLTREFKKGPRAVDMIDLHVEAGEIYGFLGPNREIHISKSRKVALCGNFLRSSGL